MACRCCRHNSSAVRRSVIILVGRRICIYRHRCGITVLQATRLQAQRAATGTAPQYHHLCFSGPLLRLRTALLLFWRAAASGTTAVPCERHSIIITISAGRRVYEKYIIVHRAPRVTVLLFLRAATSTTVGPSCLSLHPPVYIAPISCAL